MDYQLIPSKQVAKKSGFTSAIHNYMQGFSGVKGFNDGKKRPFLLSEHLRSLLELRMPTQSVDGSGSAGAASGSPSNLRIPLRTTDRDRSKSSSSFAKTSSA